MVKQVPQFSKLKVTLTERPQLEQKLFKLNEQHRRKLSALAQAKGTTETDIIRALIDAGYEQITREEVMPA